MTIGTTSVSNDGAGETLKMMLGMSELMMMKPQKTPNLGLKVVRRCAEGDAKEVLK